MKSRHRLLVDRTYIGPYFGLGQIKISASRSRSVFKLLFFKESSIIFDLFVTERHNSVSRRSPIFDLERHKMEAQQKNSRIKGSDKKMK